MPDNDIATDALCPQCRKFQPVIWQHIELAELYAGQMGRFVGLEMRCQICQFEITKVGRVLEPINMLAAMK